MDAWLIAILCFVGGAAVGALGALAVAWRLNSRRPDGTALANAQTRATLLDEQLQRQGQDIAALRAESSRVDALREQAERRAAVAAEQLQQRQAHFAEQLAQRGAQFEEQRQLLVLAEQRLSDSFASLGSRALKSNNEQFLTLAKEAFEKLMTQAQGDVEKKHLAIDALVKPIRELLEKQSVAVTEIETKRETAYARLDEQLKAVATSHEGLKTETGRLVTALRRPETRGRWGEIQLRNVVELAGMTNHCDFCEQQSVRSNDGPGGTAGSLRPDMIVRMPGGGQIVVDSKVALDAYLDMLQPDADRDHCLKRHARHVAEHMKSLAGKKYWEQFERAPRIVVMFMPLEPALSAALEHDPELQAQAMGQSVLIATPTTLMAVLRAVAFGWQQEDLAANARQISEAGRELYERIGKFVELFAKVGTQLRQATGAYNAAVGSMESRLLVGARKLKELHATTEAEIESPAPLEVEVRPLAPAGFRLTSDATES